MPLKNFQYNKILREYDARQLESKHRLDRHVKEVYEKIPVLKKIDEQIVSNSIDSAKSALSGNEKALNALKESNMELSLQKKELLIANGYPGNFLEPEYHCPDCKDTGFIGSEKCHCFKQAVVDLLYSQSNRKQILKEENFSTFSYSYYNDSQIDSATGMTPLTNMKRVTGLCHKFINEFNTNYTNLLLYGNTGVGKTFLANCIAKELLDSSHTVIYLTAFQLFDILEKNKFKKNPSDADTENQFTYILDCDLLIIDDLGTELNNAFITSQLYLCINERHLRRNATIISTNLSWEDIKNNYSERIFSRITSDYLFLKIFGEDIRIKKAFSE